MAARTNGWFGRSQPPSCSLLAGRFASEPAFARFDDTLSVLEKASARTQPRPQDSGLSIRLLAVDPWSAASRGVYPPGSPNRTAGSPTVVGPANSASRIGVRPDDDTLSVLVQDTGLTQPRPQDCRGLESNCRFAEGRRSDGQSFAQFLSLGGRSWQRRDQCPLSYVMPRLAVGSRDASFFRVAGHVELLIWEK